ncbi:hypothetical protein BH23ACT9_BH23ACT9_03290 [soil metagenome]
MIPALAHALPQSIGVFPLTLVLTAMLAAYLVVGVAGTRRAVRLVGRVPATGSAPAATGSAPAATRDAPAGRSGGPLAEAIQPVRPTPWHSLGVLGLVAVAVLATFGPPDAGRNLTDQAVLVLLWGAVAISSMLLGPWWPRIDPLRGLSGALSAAMGDPEQRLARPLPRRVGTTSAAVGLGAWAWVEVLTNPSVVFFQALLLAYVTAHLAATMRYGATWLEQAESMHVMSRTLGLLRPTGGGPLRRLSEIPDKDRLRWVCGALIGWSLADLLTETSVWHDLPRSTTQWLGPVLLVLAVTGTYGLIRAVSGRFRLGPAFVAVAGAWVVAHYLSALVIEGQGVPIWLSDPFGTGADLLGRRGTLIDLEAVPLTLLAVLQSVPFVAGHLAAVVIVQRRAARRVSTPGQLGPATFFARTLIAALLLTGTYLQLGGI